MEQLPRLILITDWTLERPLLLSRLALALRLGPQLAVQMRHPEVSGRQFLEEAQAVAQVANEAGCSLFVNGRLDVALLTGAHLHLPSGGLSVDEARRHLPKDRWVSLSVHHEEEVPGARGADLALVAPVFSPGSKPGDSRPRLGVEGFWTLAHRLPCPAYALGGICPETASALAGAAGVAVVSSVLRSPDPQGTAAAILENFG